MNIQFKDNKSRQKTEQGNRLAHAARPDLPDFGEILQKMALTELQPLIDRDLPMLEGYLNELVKIDTDDSVKVVCRVFSTECEKYRLSALRMLARMENLKAKKAISRRASWFSSASKNEKEIARSILK